jgi:hypothetical protein
MTLIDVRNWSKQNVYPLQSGEFAARPGLRRIATPDAGRIFVGGFTVQNPYTGDVAHYLFDVISASTTQLRVRILDEDFVVWQELGLQVNVDPRVITHAVVEGEIIISSPDFDTLWGLVGSGLSLARAVASDNPATTAIPVPRGICTPWCNRVVIANGASLFISDPVTATGGSTQTYVGENQNQRPGPVYGIHEGAGGQLIALTTRGVYGLDSSASAVGIVGSSGTDWRLLNHHESYSYASSAVVRGRCFALSRAGYMLVDIENNKEEVLDDVMAPRAYGIRVANSDYRSCRIFAGDEGPWVAYGDLLSAHGLDDGTRSWWTCAVDTTFRLRGCLRTADGGEMLLCEDGIYLPGGNVDGGQLLSTEAATQPKAIMCGAVPTNPAQNPTVREVTYAASVGGAGSIYAAVRGDAQSATPPADTRSLIIGTNSWGDAGKTYQPSPVVSRRLQFDLNGDDVTIEVAADFPETRLGAGAAIEVSKSAPDRPDDRGQ